MDSSTDYLLWRARFNFTNEFRTEVARTARARKNRRGTRAITESRINALRGRTRMKLGCTDYMRDYHKGRGAHQRTCLRDQYTSKQAVSCMIEALAIPYAIEDDFLASVHTYCKKNPRQKKILFGAMFVPIDEWALAIVQIKGYSIENSECKPENKIDTLRNRLARSNNSLEPKIDVGCLQVISPWAPETNHPLHISTQERDKATLTKEEKERHIEIDLLLWIKSGAYRPPPLPGFSDLTSMSLTLEQFLEFGFDGDAALWDASEDAILREYPDIGYSTMMIRNHLNQNNVQAHAFAAGNYFKDQYNLVTHDAGTFSESASSASRKICQEEGKEKDYEDWGVDFFVPLARRMKETHDSLGFKGEHANTRMVTLYYGSTNTSFGRKVPYANGHIEFVEMRHRKPEFYNEPPLPTPTASASKNSNKTLRLKQRKRQHNYGDSRDNVSSRFNEYDKRLDQRSGQRRHLGNHLDTSTSISHSFWNGYAELSRSYDSGRWNSYANGSSSYRNPDYSRSSERSSTSTYEMRPHRYDTWIAPEIRNSDSLRSSVGSSTSAYEDRHCEGSTSASSERPHRSSGYAHYNSSDLTSRRDRRDRDDDRRL